MVWTTTRSEVLSRGKADPDRRNDAIARMSARPPKPLRRHRVTIMDERSSPYVGSNFNRSLRHDESVTRGIENDLCSGKHADVQADSAFRDRRCARGGPPIPLHRRGSG